MRVLGQRVGCDGDPAVKLAKALKLWLEQRRHPPCVGFSGGAPASRLWEAPTFDPAPSFDPGTGKGEIGVKASIGPWHLVKEAFTKLNNLVADAFYRPPGADLPPEWSVAGGVAHEL